MKRIYDAVKTITERKVSDRIEPSIALVSEICRHCPDRSEESIKEHISNLSDAGLVVTGHTINDVYVKLTER